MDRMDFRIGKLNGRKIVTFSGNDGKRIRIRLNATTPEKAAIEGYQIYLEYREKIERGRSWTIGEIWNAYKLHLGNRPSGRNMVGEGQSIIPVFGDLRPSDITEELVQTYIASRVHRYSGGKVSDGTLWTELGRLRDAIKYAERKHWITANDIRYIPRPQKPEPRDRWLNDDEIVDLLIATSNTPHLHLAIHILLATAGRVGAVLELTWDRVNFEEGTIDLRVAVPGRKKKRAKVPMTDSLRGILLSAKAHATCNHVIEWHDRPIKTIKTAFYRAVADAGLKDVSPHVLRHTAAVRMAAAGCSMERIAAYLGHSDPAITRKVYAKFAPDHLKEEASAVDIGHLMKIAARRGAKMKRTRRNT
ncbi:tyrosine-type recombinase/integrase [Limimaricola sp. AA108-03]|uniref:tyrosine-type recombinase/integrase n=1 Tax=Limimaricola sp. AA108-03 TaxID=3425945 RepID=UPI003D777796